MGHKWEALEYFLCLCVSHALKLFQGCFISFSSDSQQVRPRPPTCDRLWFVFVPLIQYIRLSEQCQMKEESESIWASAHLNPSIAPSTLLHPSPLMVKVNRQKVPVALFPPHYWSPLSLWGGIGGADGYWFWTPKLVRGQHDVAIKDSPCFNQVQALKRAAKKSDLTVYSTWQESRI